MLLFNEAIGVVLAPALMPSAKQFRADGVTSDPRLATRTRPDACATRDEPQGCQAMTAPAQTVAVFEHYFFAIEAALGGLGACAVPWHLVADAVTAGQLVAPFGFRATSHRYVVRRMQRADRKSADFCHWLQEEAANLATVDQP